MKKTVLLLKFSHGLRHAKGVYRRGQITQKAVNAGMLTDREKGDPFTEPSVYNSKHNLTAVLKTPKKVLNVVREQKANQVLQGLDITSQEQMGLDKGTLSPTSAESKAASEFLNQKELGLNTLSRSELKHGTGRAQFGRGARDLMHREQVRQEAVKAKYPQPPSGKEFFALTRKLRREDDEESTITMIQQRLIDEHGIFPTTRVDSYMLDDESYFPEWVNKLPWSIRDRVKYGNMGLTEEDEALRVRLGRLSADQRAREWQRLKKAKQYEAAVEERLSPTELRDARQGSREFHWLQRKRQMKATTIRRLALRRPDKFESWPSDAVDYSRRVALIAQHVENGVATKGQWPLDPEELAKAKIRRRQEEAERTFLKTSDERKMLNTKKMHGSVAATLQQMDSIREEPPIKRLSRKVYANRVNAVKHGDQDEYGHKYRKLETAANKRYHAFKSFEELAVERETRKEPKPNYKGPRRSDNEHWSKRQQEHTYAEGLPSLAKSGQLQ